MAGRAGGLGQRLGQVGEGDGVSDIDSDAELEARGHVPGAVALLVDDFAHLVELVHLDLVRDPLDPLAATQTQSPHTPPPQRWAPMRHAAGRGEALRGQGAREPDGATQALEAHLLEASGLRHAVQLACDGVTDELSFGVSRIEAPLEPSVTTSRMWPNSCCPYSSSDIKR